MSDEIEKRFARIEKTLNYVARGGSQQERIQAAKLIAKWLRENPLPIRWFVPKATQCQLVPSVLMTPGDLRQAKAVIRVVELRKDNWFQERQRVRVDDDLALESGYLYFERHGYAIFVPVQSVTAML